MAPSRRKKGVRARIPHGDTVHSNDPPAKQLPLPPPFFPDALDGDRHDRPRSPLTIFTIGHSNHEADALLALLRQYECRTLVDVRSAPYSRYAPHFNQTALADLLAPAGVQYIWEGDALGGRPADPACNRDGVVHPKHVDYQTMARRPAYLEGLQRLREYAANGLTVLMCSEEDPRRCHRHLLIEPTLRAHGAIVMHIRRGGVVETIEPDEPAAPDIPDPQLSLIGF
jgi:hypothetical protein